MNQVAVANPIVLTPVEQALLVGDLAKLTPEQRAMHVKQTCDSLGLNPITRPFEYITLNGKLTLYARKDCTDQLRSLRRVSIRIVSRETIEGVYVVTAQATLPDGRADESTGAVQIAGLKGDALANAMMKAETKAKRRVTLSVCGLGMLDETEVDSIPDKDKNPMAMERPGEADGSVVDAIYRFDFGQYRGKTVEEVYNDGHPKCGPEGLRKYVEFLDAQEMKGPLSPKAFEARKHIEDFLGAVECAEPALIQEDPRYVK